MKRIAEILCLVELLLLILFPIGAWVASMLGADIVNLVSEEALRWLFQHGPEELISVHLALLILFIAAVGAVQECGIITVMRHHEHRYQRRALRVSLGCFLFITLLLLTPVVMRQSALLSVTGSLIPSPWLYGFPLAMCVNVIVSSILFAAFNRTLHGIFSITHLLSAGISRYGLLVVDFMMASLLVAIIKYCI